VTKKERDSYSKAFGVQIRSLRLKAGFGKREFAREADVEYSLLGRIEDGLANPTMITIIKLAEALKIAPGNLLNFEVSKK
jgi:transcriptional regulator with XRE-family HTH domain